LKDVSSGNGRPECQVTGWLYSGAPGKTVRPRVAAAAPIRRSNVAREARATADATSVSARSETRRSCLDLHQRARVEVDGPGDGEGSPGHWLLSALLAVFANRGGQRGVEDGKGAPECAASREAPGQSPRGGHELGRGERRWVGNGRHAASLRRGS
jgi:hypothetical protein